MNLYKVTFHNNVAVSADHLFVPIYDNVRVETLAGERTVKWITVFADDETDSIHVANETVNDFFQYLETA